MFFEKQNISIFLAFTAGILSFLSPCILPLIPSYLSFITGISFQELTTSKKIRKMTILHSLLFILGFSLIFILLGATATYLGNLLLKYQIIIKKIGGVLIILFGLYITGLLKLDFLTKERKIHLTEKPIGYFGTILVGATFAFGWSPCIGPILSTILLYASTSEKLSQGIVLLVFYSLGLGIPFFLTSLLVNSFLSYFEKFKRYLPSITLISGIFLIIAGFLLILDKFSFF
jgi:cytochrome c-type biogenesis protein